MKIPALLLALLLASTVASAQPAGEAQGAPPLPPGEIQKLLDGYEFVQAQEYLGLTDAQFAQFLPKLRGLQEVRRRNEQERMRLLMELRRMTNARSQVAEGDVQMRVRALRDLEMKAASETQGARDAIDQVLSVRQQALFRLFQQEIEQRKLQLLMRTRQQQQQQNRANRPLGKPKN
jgi:hypothetical protein